MLVSHGRNGDAQGFAQPVSQGAQNGGERGRGAPHRTRQDSLSADAIYAGENGQGAAAQRLFGPSQALPASPDEPCSRQGASRTQSWRALRRFTSIRARCSNFTYTNPNRAP